MVTQVVLLALGALIGFIGVCVVVYTHYKTKRRAQHYRDLLSLYPIAEEEWVSAPHILLPTPIQFQAVPMPPPFACLRITAQPQIIHVDVNTGEYFCVKEARVGRKTMRGYECVRREHNVEYGLLKWHAPTNVGASWEVMWVTKDGQTGGVSVLHDWKALQTIKSTQKCWGNAQLLRDAKVSDRLWEISIAATSNFLEYCANERILEIVHKVRRRRAGDTNS